MVEGWRVKSVGAAIFLTIIVVIAVSILSDSISSKASTAARQLLSAKLQEEVQPPKEKNNGHKFPSILNMNADQRQALKVFQAYDSRFKDPKFVDDLLAKAKKMKHADVIQFLEEADDRHNEDALPNWDRRVRMSTASLMMTKQAVQCRNSVQTITGSTFWEEGEHEHAKNIAACVIVTDEARHIDEWVTFHWLQGVGAFMIFDDSSLDGTSQRLQKYIDRGIVEQINVSRPDGRLANEEERMLYMETCIAKFATAVEDEESNEGNWKPDWLILARPDEYYFANEPDSTLAEALKVSTAAHECVQVPVTQFGTGGWHWKPPYGLLIQNFLLAGEEDGSEERRFIYNLGVKWAERNLAITGKYEIAAAKCATPNVLAGHIRCNSYFRSLEEFDEKLLRHPNYDLPFDKTLDEYWSREYDDRIDDSALHHACKVKAALDYVQGKDVPNVKRVRLSKWFRMKGPQVQPGGRDMMMKVAQAKKDPEVRRFMKENNMTDAKYMKYLMKKEYLEKKAKQVVKPKGGGQQGQRKVRQKHSGHQGERMHRRGQQRHVLPVEENTLT